MKLRRTKKLCHFWATLYIRRSSNQYTVTQILLSLDAGRFVGDTEDVD